MDETIVEWLKDISEEIIYWVEKNERELIEDFTVKIVRELVKAAFNILSNREKKESGRRKHGRNRNQ